MNVLFEHPLITVWYHERRQIVHHRVNRPILTEELPVIQKAFTSGSDVMRKYRANKWLSDDRLQLVMPTEIQDWCQNTWFPATRRLGWSVWAIVQPESAVARLFIGRLLVNVLADGMRAQAFNDVSSAMVWLDKQEQTITP